MSRPEFGDDERQLRPREEDEGWDRWLNAIIYYGLGQVMLLGLPTLWLAVVAPTHRGAVVDATAVGVVCVSLAVGAGRLGLLPSDRPWPVLGSSPLGGTGGYAAYLARTTLLNTTFMWVAYGSVAVTLLVPVPVPAYALGAVVAVGSVMAYPWLSGPTRRARTLRAGYQIVGLALLLAVVDVGTALDAGVFAYPVFVGLLGVLVALDGLPLLTGGR